MANYRYRQWIKTRMSEKEDGQKAVSIWQQWKKARQASTHVARAIRIYNALLKGDVEDFQKLMRKYFPGYGMALGGEQPQPGLQSMPTQPSGNHKANGKVRERPKIIIDRDAYNEDALEEDDEFGFAKLEIG